MAELIKREVTDNDTAVCLIEQDGIFTVSVNKDYGSYDKEFYFLFEAYDFFDWTVENE